MIDLCYHKGRGEKMTTTLLADCVDCDQEFPVSEMTEKYSGYSEYTKDKLWCDSCERGYAPESY
jgi:hypothetical protein